MAGRHQLGRVHGQVVVVTGVLLEEVLDGPHRLVHGERVNAGTQQAVGWFGRIRGAHMRLLTAEVGSVERSHDCTCADCSPPSGGTHRLSA